MSNYGKFVGVAKQSPFSLKGVTINPDDLIQRKLSIKIVDEAGEEETAKEFITLNTFEHQAGEYIMYSLAEFDEISERLNFDWEDKFTYFPRTLGPTPLSDWHTIVDGRVHDEANYNAARAELLTTHFGNESHDHLLEYLRAFRKPYDMSTRILAKRYSTVMRYSRLLPEAVDVPQYQVNKMFFDMFPQENKRNYLANYGANKLRTTNVSTLADYFSYFDGTAKKRTNDDDGGNPRRGKKKKHLRNNKHRKRDDKKDDANMCRIHAGLGSDKNHKWKDCIYNPNGHKYCGHGPPDKKKPTDKNGGEKKKPRDSYHVDDEEKNVSFEDEQETHYHEPGFAPDYLSSPEL